VTIYVEPTITPNNAIMISIKENPLSNEPKNQTKDIIVPNMAMGIGNAKRINKTRKKTEEIHADFLCFAYNNKQNDLNISERVLTRTRNRDSILFVKSKDFINILLYREILHDKDSQKNGNGSMLLFTFTLCCT